MTNRSILLAAICLYLPTCYCASIADRMFDAQQTPSATKTSVDSGAQRAVTDAENSVSQRRYEIEERKRKESERISAERAVGNGRRYYKCEFICITSGLLGDSTDKMSLTVKANEEWEAKDKMRESAKSICIKFRGNVDFHRGESMYPSNERCEEIR